MTATTKKKAQILIVDDTPTNIDVLGSMLSNEYDIRVALNGSNALNIVRSKEPPDLVLLDVMMPGMDGYEVAKEIKKDPEISSIPIIFVTAKVEEQDEAIGFELGAVDYIRKPVSKIVTLSRVRNHLELKLHRDRMAKSILEKDLQLKDSTERLANETKSAFQNLIYFKELFKSSPYGIMLVDTKRKIKNVNEAFSNILGYPRQEVLGKDFPSIFRTKDKNSPCCTFTDFMEKALQGENVNFETRCQHKKGCTVPIKSLAYPVKYDGKVHGIFIFYENISQRKRFEKKLKHQAFYDALTGIPNRAFLKKQITIALDQQAHDHDYKFAVMLMDLDRFKNVNDTLGHQAGDALLKMVCKRFQSCLRDSDVLARIGGDEFFVLLSGFKNHKEIQRIAVRLQKAAEQPFDILGTEACISTSIGIVIDTKGYENINDLFRDVDLAMYHAKDSGKAKFKIFTPQMHQNIMETMTIEQELRKAIKQEEFILHYQPIIRLDKSNTLDGFEVLIRWEHPTKGLIQPSQFIPIAEETGLILPMGKWVFKKACETLASWQNSLEKSVSININISIKQFMYDGFVDEILSIVELYKISPDNIKLEFTESLIMEQRHWAIKKLNLLKEIGFIISIDDFGTGYSSLSYLSEFPIDQIKIDRSFINSMEKKEQNKKIVRLILSLCKSLDITAIAEGVETDAQVRFLSENSCDCIQGFYYGKPTSKEKAMHFLNTNKIAGA